ncbi:discoidin domain-containing protein [Kitasatospora sp. NPDC088783]|uniref:discoidin domain-containing protein n=1 Tax=Kitasatospora sp. NPDC088783 TaxID=3364077 RepID=UPI003824640A
MTSPRPTGTPRPAAAPHRVLTLLLAVAAALLPLAPDPAHAAPAPAPAAFTLYDDTAYAGVDIGHGAVPANLVPNRVCTPLVAGGALPAEATWKSLVAQYDTHPDAPLVLDCESLYLTGDAATAADHLNRLATLQTWARQVAPTQLIGWYGLLGNTATAHQGLYRQLIAQDRNTAFFPSAYTYATGYDSWLTTLKGNLAAAAQIDPAVPVLPYVWPQYHDGTGALSLTWVPAAQFAFQLATLHDLGLPGAVIWGGSNPAVCDTACQSGAGSQGWLPATRAFLDWSAGPEGTAADLALGRPVTVSSSYSSTLTGPNAVDGSPYTRWASAYADPQSLTVDLGAVRTVEGVRLVWNTGYGSAYRVQLSTDGSAWTTVRTVTGGTGGVEYLTGLHGTGRYLRLDLTTRGTAYAYSLWSLDAHAV